MASKSKTKTKSKSPKKSSPTASGAARKPAGKAGGRTGAKSPFSPGKKKGGAPRKKSAADATGPRRNKVKAKKPVAPPPPVVENPRAKALAHRIAALVGEKKAVDTVILDVRGKTAYADYLVVSSGESERQVSAMAEHVEVKLKEEGVRPLGTEGYDTGNWVLLDFGEVVAHLFFTEVRAFYDIEGLWADAAKEKVA